MKIIYRKSFHIITIGSIYALSFLVDTKLDRVYFEILAISLIVLILIAEIFRIKHREFNKKIWNRLSHFFKKEEERKFTSAIWTPIDLLILSIFFSKIVMVSTLGVLAFSDSIAAIMGKKFGGKGHPEKSGVGTFTFFLISFLVITFTSFILNIYIPVALIAIVSLIGALVERYGPTFGDDNFTVPMAVAVAFELVLRYLF